MKAEGVSFRHAVELLRNDSPSLAAQLPTGKRGRQTGTVAQHSTTPKLSAPIEREADDEVLLRQVADFYHQTLRDTTEGQEYLRQRGLGNAELVETFRLGLANRTLGYRLPQKNRQEGAKMRGRLQRLGVLRESGHEHFNGSLVVPIFDAEGRVAEMYGRKITEGLRRGTPKHLYLPGPHRGVWNLQALQASPEIILCESLIDAMTFWCAGHRNVTTSYGTEGFTEDHREAFRRHEIRRVYIAYDRDAAGDKAAEKLAAELTEQGIEAFRVLFPKGMDANEYALKVQPAEKSLDLAVKQAQWLGKGKPASLPRVVESEPAPEPEIIEAEPVSDVADAEPVSNVADAEESAPSSASELTPPAPADPLPTPEPPLSLAAEPLEPPPSDRPLPEPPHRDEVQLRFGDRRWRIRGLSKNPTPEAMKVNVLVTRDGGAFHVDTLELYSARQRGHFTKLASTELGLEEQVIKTELGRVLLKLEELQEQQLKKELEAQQKTPQLSAEEKAAALRLLKDPELVPRLLQDFEACGVVGEQTNKLVGYLAAVSRKLDDPLAIVVQSSSAAGKSSLMDAILAFMPEEERVQYSAMTGQSLFYMGEQDLRHRILAIVEEEGAEKASYALKLLQSEGQLTIASTGKDSTTGRLVTQEYRVEGPVMIFLTTTAIEIDEELLNRCIVLTVDEGREQTRAIHHRQRQSQTLEGVLGKEDRRDIRKLHRDAQRLLRPLLVVNPFAHELKFLDHQTRTRRDHMKYLTVIRSIALLHQYQRQVKTVEHKGRQLRYIEVTRQDIAMANRLCQEVLGRSLDELPPQTRRLLMLVEQLVADETKRLSIKQEDFRFSRRTVREHTRWSQTQLRIHLGRLVEMEYLAVHRGG